MSHTLRRVPVIAKLPIPITTRGIITTQSPPRMAAVIGWIRAGGMGGKWEGLARRRRMDQKQKRMKRKGGREGDLDQKGRPLQRLSLHCRPREIYQIL
jgi:hypothetical protein